MKAKELFDDDLVYLNTPPKTFLYWRIKDTYLVVAVLEEWDTAEVTLKTEEGIIFTENRDDVKIMVP
ncbi:hypothetical protein [Acinetobacter piscicola]|uniref:hypothetical protein n=1 Tax=Acinetobacter piscicola TaxID=2006115 RepID=UPI000B7ED8EF|nr:hypothetical protein [Acinetobacter piscicola]